MSASVNVPLSSRGKLASSLPAEQLAEITELFEYRLEGHSLDAPFYTDPAIFKSTCRPFSASIGSSQQALQNFLNQATT